jgi:hypothetical protein
MAVAVVDAKSRSRHMSGTVSSWLSASDDTIDTVDDLALVKFVKALIQESEDAKMKFWIPRWLRSLYFVMGHQHIFWSQKRKRWFPMLLSADKRVVVNMVKGRWLSDAARIVKSKPNFEVVPSVPDADSREQARVGLRILRSLYRSTGFLKNRMLGAQHQAMFGGVIFKADWDPTLLPQPPQPMPVMNPDGSPMVGPEGPVPMVDGKGNPKMLFPPPLGDVIAPMRSVFDIHGPAEMPTPFFEDWPWVGEKVAIQVGDIASRWGVDVRPDVKAMDITTRIGIDLGSYFSRGDQMFEDDRAQDSAFVIEYHESPAQVKGFEQGRRIIIAGDELVENGPGILKNGKTPYHHFPMIPIPNMPWGDCFIPDMIEPNMAYNTARGDAGRARSRLRHPHMFAQVGSIATDKVTEGGRILEYAGGKGPPEVPNIPGISSAVVSEMRAAKEDIDTAASQFSFTRGQPMGASPNPVGTVELLQRADDSDLSFAISVGAEEQAALGEDLLDLSRQHYDLERVATVVGGNEDPEVFLFSKTDVDGGLRVIVQEGSEVPINKEAMRAQLTELLKSGLFGQLIQDPKFMNHVLELFEMPAPDQLANLGALDTKLQERETRRMLFGPMVMPIPINPDTDDHQAHIASIDRRVKNNDWASMDEQRKQALLTHRQEHQKAQNEQEEQQFIKQLQREAMVMSAKGGQRQQGPPQGQEQ